MATIGLEGINIYAGIGISKEERIAGIYFNVDVYVVQDVNEAAKTDNIEDTVNYAELCKIVREEMQKGGNLMESVALKIVNRVKKDYPKSQNVKVKISKIHPVLSLPVKKAFVEWEE